MLTLPTNGRGKRDVPLRSSSGGHPRLFCRQLSPRGRVGAGHEVAGDLPEVAMEGPDMRRRAVSFVVRCPSMLIAIAHTQVKPGALESFGLERSRSVAGLGL